MTFRVREATAEDWPSIWPIIQEVAAAEETFAMVADPDEDDMRAWWMTPPPGRVVVAVYGVLALAATGFGMTTGGTTTMPPRAGDG